MAALCFYYLVAARARPLLRVQPAVLPAPRTLDRGRR